MTVKMFLVYLLQSISPDIPNVDLDEFSCLVENVYHEARGESSIGKTAVASVTVNRWKHRRFPDTICGVVRHSSKPNSNKGCAFSWVCSGKSLQLTDRRGNIDSKKSEVLEEITKISLDVLAGKIKDPTNGATHFHNIHIDPPTWASDLHYIARIDKHLFYKLK